MKEHANPVDQGNITWQLKVGIGIFVLVRKIYLFFLDGILLSLDEGLLMGDPFVLKELKF